MDPKNYQLMPGGGYDPYNSAMTNPNIFLLVLGRDHAREMNAARAQYGDERNCLQSRTLPAREEIAELMPWEDFPEGVNVRVPSIFD